MKTVLKLPATAWTEISNHLFPRDGNLEQAAFLFATQKISDEGCFAKVIEMKKLASSDFEAQTENYLELKDKARANLIKRAHDLNASIVEIHSHPGPWPAEFSSSDRLGLHETVPHMRWRLPGRPYIAIVLAKSGFDALVWPDNGSLVPTQLDVLLAGNRRLYPTNHTLRNWYEGQNSRSV